VEAHEIAERIHEDAESHAHARPGHESMFRRLTAINAAFLVWAALGGWLLLKAQ